jgi:tetratricopeptide (TPR) repeat protein
VLIGPEAAAAAPPPVELPAKEAARLCLRAAQEFEASGKTAEAIRLYEKARTTDPSLSMPATRRLAGLYDKAGEFSKSTAEYETLIRDNPKDADLLNDFGYSHYCRGDWAAAEAALTQAVAADPNHKRAWVNLGLAQAQLAKWDDSFQSFCKAVRPADAHCNLGFILATRGNTEEAKAQYHLALAADPSCRLARAALAKFENPQPPAGKTKPDISVVGDRLGMIGTGSFDRPRVSGRKDYDSAEAAAKVPSIQEIESRMKAQAGTTTGVVPATDPKPVRPE